MTQASLIKPTNPKATRRSLQWASLAIAFGILTAVTASRVQAQPKRPEAAAAPTPGGAAKPTSPANTTEPTDTLTFAPAIPGVCIFSRLSAIGGSKAGLAATIRMQQIATDITNELNAQRQTISSVSGDVSSIQRRLADFSQLEQLRAAQLQRTKALAEQEIGKAIGPLIQAIVTKHACALVLDRGSAYGWNPSMDITPQVIQALDEKVPAIQVTLVSADATPR